MIVTRNGKNIYPEELEALLLKEKVVKECMVVGSESDKEDTVVKARIFPDISAISAERGNINVSRE